MDKRIMQDIALGGGRKPNPSAFLSKERRDERRVMLEPLGRLPSNGKRKKLITGIVALVAILLSGGIVLANTFAEATIIVNPKTASEDLDISIRAYKNPESPTLLKFEIVEIEASETTDVETGALKYVERKASGKITIHNDSTELVRLVQNTRFKSPSGLIYRSFSQVSIPARGSAQITVNADKPGSEYNIPPDTFTLPGLEGGVLHNKVYAKSLTAMTGGLKGDTRSVADDELASAKASLEGSLTQALLATISKKITQDKIFFPDAYSIIFTFDETPKTVNNEESAKQQVGMRGTLQALIFDKKALARILAVRSLDQDVGQIIEISNWQELSIDLGRYDNLGAVSEITARIIGKANFVWQFDEQKLRADLAGLPKEDYSRVFLNYPSIERAEVKMRPFWKGSFPSNPDRVIIKTVTP